MLGEIKLFAQSLLLFIAIYIHAVLLLGLGKGWQEALNIYIYIQETHKYLSPIVALSCQKQLTI
jgi:hypothetical protein